MARYTGDRPEDRRLTEDLLFANILYRFLVSGNTYTLGTNKAV